MYPKTTICYHLDGIHELWKQCHRLHLPIITEPEIEFCYKQQDDTGALTDITKHLSKDILVEINNFIPHGVCHNGNLLRYHLLYDILPANYSGNFSIIEHNDRSKFELDRVHEIAERQKYLIPIDRAIYKF